MRKRVEVTLASLLVLLCVGLRLAYTDSVPHRHGVADLITLDARVPIEEMERPAVRFPHELHAAGGEKARCLVCHEARPGDGSGIFFTFKGRDGLPKEAVADLYHARCIGCHEDLERAGKPTGPEMCSGCHVNEPPAHPLPSHSLNFSDSLHLLHTEDASLDCQACHDLSGAGQASPDGVAPSDTTSHALCVTCHLESVADSGIRAPLKCTGCHTSIPPSSNEMPPAEAAPRGGEVLFDHDLHEAADLACEVCHHKEPESRCAECHADGSTGKGGGVTLQAAMHSRQAAGSCVGCHEEMGIGGLDDCAACHAPFGGSAP